MSPKVKRQLVSNGLFGVIWVVTRGDVIFQICMKNKYVLRMRFT